MKLLYNKIYDEDHKFYKKNRASICSYLRHFFLLFSIFFSNTVFASEGGLNGASLSIYWCIPFVVLILSVAILPALTPRFWHHHFGKVVAVISFSFAAFFSYFYTLSHFIHLFLSVFFHEYLSFILLLLALFTVASGIFVNLPYKGTPLANVIFLFFGSFFSSLIGTTGASIILIRPLLRMNEDRQFSKHIFIFFIILIANVGGSFSPIGDPPLFIGFLLGVPFFWPLQHLFLPGLFLILSLLTLFFFIDIYYFRKEFPSLLPLRLLSTEKFSFFSSIEGKGNLVWILCIILVILLSSHPFFDKILFSIDGVDLSFSLLLRNILLIFITLMSYVMTPHRIYTLNSFSWLPIKEIGKIFMGIFLTIAPMIAILESGHTGLLSSFFNLFKDPDSSLGLSPFIFYWFVGLFSSILDNAPTYLIFFKSVGVSVSDMIGPYQSILKAISLSSVYMGALTYIGNAPNFMVRSIINEAKDNAAFMPSFFGYIFYVSCLLLPLLFIISIFFLE